MGGGLLEVSFNGTSIPMRTLNNCSGGYCLLGGDVSRHAGQFGELRFTAPTGWSPSPPIPYDSNVALDYIRFSPLPPVVWPAMLSQPFSQTAEIGARVRLAARVTGDLPLVHHWIFNETNILSVGTNSVLDIENVDPSRAGTYTVVVTNAGGAVTSTPAMLSVIPPVERRWVPALTLGNQPGDALSLDATSALVPTPNWVTFDSVLLTNSSQWYFDLSDPLPPQRFYRAWQTNPRSPPSTLDLHTIPAITLTGSIGSVLRLDFINQFGPTDAWSTLDTVTLINTTQLYFDTSIIGQPPRLWRIVPVP